MTYLLNLKKALNLNKEEKDIIKAYEMSINKQTQRLRQDYLTQLNCKISGQSPFSGSIKEEEVDDTFDCKNRPKRKQNDKLKGLVLYDPDAVCQSLPHDVDTNKIILDRDHLYQFYDKRNKIIKITENNLTNISNDLRKKQQEKSGMINLDEVFIKIAKDNILQQFNSKKTDFKIPLLMQSQFQGVDLCKPYKKTTLLELSCQFMNPKAISFLVLVADCKLNLNSNQDPDSLLPPLEDSQTCMNLIKENKAVGKQDIDGPLVNELQPQDVLEQRMEYAEMQFRDILKMHDAYWDLQKYSGYLDLTKGVWKNCEWNNAVWDKEKYIDVSQADLK